MDDDGGFFRRETAPEPVDAGPFFTCVQRKEACEDIEERDVIACGCSQCWEYLQYLDELEEAEAEERRWEARREIALEKAEDERNLYET